MKINSVEAARIGQWPTAGTRNSHMCT